MMLKFGTKALAVILSVLFVVQLLPMKVFAQEINTSTENTVSDALSMDTVTDAEKDNAFIISGEDVSKREENIKHFKNTDGSCIAVDYGYPVHYKEKADGQWMNVDYSLVSSGRGGQEGPVEYNVKAAPFGVSLSDRVEDGRTFSLNLNGYKIEWGPVGANNSQVEFAEKANDNTQLEGNDRFLALANVSSKCSYLNVYNDVDIEYCISSYGVKENIILNSSKAQNEFVYRYNIGSLKAEQTTSNTITLLDANSKAVTKITAPYMIDSEGKTSDSISLIIEKIVGGVITLRLTADLEWLLSAERRYPVTIDPVMNTQINYSQTFIASSVNYDDTNFSGRGDMYVGYESTNYVKCRGYAQFTFPTLPNGSIITDAIFQIYQHSYSCSPSDSTKTTYTLHKVTSDVNVSTVTWNTGISYSSLITDYVTLSEADNGYVHKFDITKLVKEKYETSDTIKKLGLLLKCTNESLTQPYANVRLFTANYPGIPSGAYPYVYFRYIDTKGAEGYFSYTTASAGSAGTALINNYTGNLVLTHSDESTFRIKVPATISHVYNSVSSNSQVDTKPYVGKGWRLNVQQTIRTTGLTDYPYKYTDADGTEIYFYKKIESGVTHYYDELGGKLELTVEDGAPTYRIKDDKDGELLFNVNGNLYQINDANDNYMKIYRDPTEDKITYVKDTTQNTITLTANSSGYLTSLKNDQSNRTTSYTYSSNRLTTITYPGTDNKTSTYGYSGDLLISAKGYDGYSLNFTYSGTGNRFGIAEIQEKGNTTNGQKIVFDRGKYNTTKVRSSGSDDVYGNTDDAVTVYQFDNAGRAVCVQSQNASGGNNGAALYKYTAAAVNSTGSNIKQLNRVTDEAGFGRNIVNFAVNPGAERDGGWANSPVGDATQTFTRSGNERYYGNNSFMLNCMTSSNDGRARAYQDYTASRLVPGNNYTVSAYVKTSGITKASAAYELYGIGLNLYSTGATITPVSVWSELLTDAASTAVDGGWRRVSVMITIPQGATNTRLNLVIRNATGTAYFDGIQVEQYSTAESFNLLENSSFERLTSGFPDCWTGYGLASGDGVSTAYKMNGSYAFKINGDMATEKYVYQTVPVTGTEADTYIVSGWATGNAAKEFDGNARKFKISVKVTFSDGTSLWKTPAEFNHTISDWQYSSSIFNLSDGTSANKTPVSIGVYLQYTKEPNTGYFDFVQLIKEPSPSYTYNANGELVSVAENAAQSSSMTYSNSNLTRFTPSNGYDYTYGYDTKHNMTSAKSQNNVTSAYTYNTYGEPTELTVKNNANTLNIKTTAAYANLGQYMSSLTDEDGRAVSYAYNTAKGTLSSVTNQKGIATSYTYNANNDLLTGVSSGGASVGYTYNSDNNRLTSITHNGFNYNFAYDVFGNTSSVKVGSQTLASYSYRSANGKLQSVTYGNGLVKSYGYSGNLGLMDTLNYNGVQKFTWLYKSDGTPLKYKDNISNREETYVYDSTKRLIRQNSTVRYDRSKSLHTMEYGYDLMNNISRLVNSANGVTVIPTYTYGKDNMITRHDMNTLRNQTYEYDSLNRLKTVTVNTTAPVALDYYYYLSERNTSGSDLYRTTKIKREVIGDTAYLYTYDNVGNILTVSETTRANKDNESAYVLKQSYEYDSLDRLTRENDVNTGNTIRYAYDTGGNFTTWKYYSYTTAPTSALGEPDMTYGFIYDAAWKDKLTEVTLTFGEDTYSETISYDAVGNPTLFMGKEMIWTGRELTSHDGNTHTYDSNGLRTSKTLETGEKTEYYYSGSTLMFEHREITYNGQPDGMSLFYTYNAGGQLSNIRYIIDSIGYEHNYYPVCNSRGDVEAIYDYYGNFMAKYTYDAWGLILSVTDANGNEITDMNHIGHLNPFRYRGYYFDSETGSYYLQSRYYDPGVRRFFNADGYVQTGQGLNSNNMFSYCGNNPVVRADPSGRFFISAIIATVAIAVVAIALTGCSAKKVEPYTSPDAAARAFSEEVYNASLYIRHEYSTEIYSRTKKGITTYNYNSPRAGQPHSASVGNSTPRGTTTVAYAHTHPNSNSFSGADIRAAESLNINAYVVGPNLELQRYNLASATTTNLGVIAPIALTDERRAALVSEFQVSWDNHVAAGCDFNCGSMTWPTP